MPSFFHRLFGGIDTVKTTTQIKPARKPAAVKAVKAMISPAFFRVMDEMLDQQRRDRRKLARQLGKQAA